MIENFLPLVLVLAIGASPVAADDPPRAGDPETSEPAVTKNAEEDGDTGEEDELKVFEWGSKGLDIRSRDGNFHAHIDWRAQLRFTSRDFDDPIAPGFSTATATS